LGGLAKDLACVAGGREDRAITGAGKIPHPLGGQRPGRQQRLPQAGVPLVRDHHALAVMLGERGGPFLTPGIELGPGGNRARQSCHQHPDAPPWGKTHSGTPLRLHPMFHVVLVSRWAGQCAHHCNDSEIPASLATVNRRVCEPSTTHEVWPIVIRSDRIGWAGDSLLEAKAALTLPGRLGSSCPCTARPRSGVGTWT